MGREDLIGDERYGDEAARNERPDEVIKIVTDWTSKRTKYEVFHALASAGVWCGAVLSPEEILTNEHLITRDMVVDVNDKDRGDYKMIGCPIKLSRSPVKVERAPLYSEHTDEILKEVVGIDPNEIPSLREQGIIV